MWSGGDASTPKVETCPHCLNGGGGAKSGQCGITGNTNYDTPPNALGGSMPKNIQATYVMEQEIDVKIHITAHHKGHFEFFVCPIAYGEVPTRACFWSNPLEFVQDLKYGAPKHDKYPYRAYIPPSGYTNPSGQNDLSYEFRLKLPKNVKGDLVLLQWWWVSANSCEAPGYADYSFPSAWNITGGSLSQCSVQADGTITGAEQFWNCAEVQIIHNGPPAPTPTTVVTASPTSAPSVKPTMSSPDTASPTATPTLKPVSPTTTPSPTISSPVQYGNYCGTSWFDAAKCGIPCPTGNSTVCAFSEHCYANVLCGGTSGPTTSRPSAVVTTAAPTAKTTKAPVTPPTSSPVASPTTTTKAPVVSLSPTKSPITSNGPYCGDGVVGNGICENPSYCCSKWGYCGTEDAWCGSSNTRRLRLQRET